MNALFFEPANNQETSNQKTIWKRSELLIPTIESNLNFITSGNMI